MTLLKNNTEALRKKCEDVSLNEVDDLISVLEKELNYINRFEKIGIGLAAPQIGLYKKIAIIRLNNINLNLVNCKIHKSFDPLIYKDEGCLSFPGTKHTTKRYGEIHVINNLIEPYNFIASGFLAIVCQHEIDHYNQKLFFDYAIEEIKQNSNPNDMCKCGSNKKFKKCCGKKL